MQEKVTVISVVKNLIKDRREEYFKQMVESVSQQTYKNIEHIIVDGMSDDGTWEFINSFKNTFNFVCYRQMDKNPYDAMNKAIQKYGKEYIIILHSDDYLYDKGVIEMQVKYIEMTNSDYVTGDTIFVDKNSQQVFPDSIKNFAHEFDKNYEEYIEKGDNIPVFWYEIPFNHEGIIIRKKCFNIAGYFDGDDIYGIGADFKLEIDFILKDLKYVYIPYTLLCFRIGGMSSNSDANKYYNILDYLYSKFYFKRISDKSKWDYLRRKPDDLFFFGLKNYLRSLKLNNFDYEKCFNFLDVMRSKQRLIPEPVKSVYTPDPSPEKIRYSQKRYRVFGIPLIKKIDTEDGGAIYKLFWHWMLLRVTVDKKNRRIYKLFGRLPIFKIYLDIK